ncbi:MAG: RnfABCDGE type electron transport complex subunit D [Phycisphaerae bacterium]
MKPGLETSAAVVPKSQMRYGIIESPFLRAPEAARTVYLVTLATACAPLVGGLVMFGWRVLVVAALAVGTCTAMEKLYYRITRVPALLGRSHAFLTGLLLTLTLPPHVPWYVPVVGGAFAVIVGKAIFGGVGHFLWQPALVGRLAVAVLFAGTMNPQTWPLLSREHVVTGDIEQTRRVEDYNGWRFRPAPPGADGFRLVPPQEKLRQATLPEESGEASYSALAELRQPIPDPRPILLLNLPPLNDLLYGARPGAIGETCIVVIFVSGLYLIYRNYVKWQLPVTILAAAWLVAAAAPVKLAGPNQTVELVWWPLMSEGLDVGFTYVNYQMLSGGLMLAAFFFATEMTCRPVTTGGQVLFGAGVGAGAMLLQLYTTTPIPAYMAVLAMNTLVPAIDALWRPRVMGQKHFAFLRSKLKLSR